MAQILFLFNRPTSSIVRGQFQPRATCSTDCSRESSYDSLDENVSNVKTAGVSEIMENLVEDQTLNTTQQGPSKYLKQQPHVAKVDFSDNLEEKTGNNDGAEARIKSDMDENQLSQSSVIHHQQDSGR